MNALFDERVRRIIPRWREAATTARLGELGSLNRQQQRFSSSHLLEKLADWSSDQSLFVATDIIGTAILVDDTDETVVKKVAQAILIEDWDATPIARQAAARVLHGAHVSETFAPTAITRAEIYQRIHDLRRSIANDLRNGIAWVDLSYLYTLIGESGKAADAMRMALGVAPQSRHVIRSAARLYVHNDKREMALWLLRRSDRTPFDPWLVATEIGVAGLLGQSPRLTKVGATMATSGAFAPHDVTEVTAALGTLEAEHGNRRKARRLFELSLQDPNDNVLAQAAWAARATQAIDIDPANIDVPFSFEARARIAFRQRAFTDSLRESEAWFNDQRFSVGAAAFASYVAGVVLGKHDHAIAVLSESLVANPEDWTLRNNLAFSLASIGRVAEAREIFAGLSPEIENPVRNGVWLATSGLLACRNGDVVGGQRLYDEAMATFHRHRLDVPRAVAAVFKAREALHAQLPTAGQSLDDAIELASRASSPELETLVDQLQTASSTQLSLLP